MVKVKIEPTKEYWIVNGEKADEQRDIQITRCLIQDIKDGNGTDKDILKLCRRADITLPPNTATLEFYKKNVDMFQKLIYSRRYNKNIQKKEKNEKPNFVLIPDHFKWRKVMRELCPTKEEQQTIYIMNLTTNTMNQGIYTDKFGKTHNIFVDTKHGKVYIREWIQQFIPGYRYQLIPEYNYEDKGNKATSWETYSYTRTMDKPIEKTKIDKNWYIHLSQDDCDFTAGVPFANGELDTEVPLKQKFNIYFTDENKPDNIKTELIYHEDTTIDELPECFIIKRTEDPPFVPISQRYRNNWDDYFNWCKENKGVIA